MAIITQTSEQSENEFSANFKALSMNDKDQHANEGCNTNALEDATNLDDPQACAERATAHNWKAPVPYDYEGFEVPWFSKARRYEWNDEHGDIAPPDEELEKELFVNHYHSIQGSHMEKLSNFQITLHGEIPVDPIRDFKNAGLHPLILENISKCGYNEPTPIQCYAIPAALQGYDVFAVAQAGSGKTGAYIIPILSKLAGKCLKLAAKRPGLGLPMNAQARAQPLVLIIAPTRELVNQIFDHCRRLCYRTMLRPCVAYGGGPVGVQINELKRGCDILIATVGRLKDFVQRAEVLSLEKLRFIVFDEADELMNEDWTDDIQSILTSSRFKSNVQTMMFSATFGGDAQEAASRYTRTGNCVRIEVGRVGSTHGNIAQVIKWVDDDLKQKATYDLLFSLLPARTLIFVNHKRTAEELDDFLFNRKLPSCSLHSDRLQREREKTLIDFRLGHSPILVTTAIAARGIDIHDVHHVINYDLPSASSGGIDEYVHRIGRTGRIGNEGLATSFFNVVNEDIALDLVKLLIEAQQPVPKFLNDHVPDHYNVEWDEDVEEQVIQYVKTPDIDQNALDTGNDEDVPPFELEEFEFAPV